MRKTALCTPKLEPYTYTSDDTFQHCLNTMTMAQTADDQFLNQISYIESLDPHRIFSYHCGKYFSWMEGQFLETPKQAWTS